MSVVNAQGSIYECRVMELFLDGSYRWSEIISGCMAGAASNIFFYLLFIYLSCVLPFYPNSASAMVHVEGLNKMGL
jgi:hypothetical protein